LRQGSEPCCLCYGYVIGTLSARTQCDMVLHSPGQARGSPCLRPQGAERSATHCAGGAELIGFLEPAAKGGQGSQSSVC